MQINAAVQVGAGALLAIGKWPRISALALAGTVVPTTLAGHDFWNYDDPAARAQHRTQFLKNVGLLGGLLLASVDTEGKPSLGWRGRRAARHAQEAVVAALPGSTSDHTAGDALHTVSGRVKSLTGEASQQGSSLLEKAKERAPEYAEVARERGTEILEVARERGPEIAEVARERGTELLDAAKEHVPELTDTAKERRQRIPRTCTEPSSRVCRGRAPARFEVVGDDPRSRDGAGTPGRGTDLGTEREGARERAASADTRREGTEECGEGAGESREGTREEARVAARVSSETSAGAP